LGPVCSASDATATVVTGALPCFNSYTQQIGPSTYQFSTNDLAFFVQDDWRVHPHFTVNIGLRYETELMPSPQVPNAALPLTDKFPSDFKDFGPRVGFAWDITGDGKTIARAGYGIFYGRIINSSIANAISNTANLQGSQLSFFFPQTAAGSLTYPNVLAAAPSGAPGALQAVQFAPHTSNPMVHEFDIDFQREIATNTVVSVSYLGSLGGNLPRFVDTNLGAPSHTVTYKFAGGPFAGQSLTVPVYTSRPNSSFGAITNISDSVTSKYNALVVGLNRRFYQGFQIQTSFTYSHANDAGQSSQTFTATNNVLNPFDLTQEQGRSNFDIRERFAFGAVWTPDLYKGSHLILKELVNGFTISPLINISSGAPYTGLLSGTAPALDATGKSCKASTPGCFSAISSGVLGAGGSNRLPNLPPNAFQMPRTANVDLRLEKSFHLTERRAFTLTADAFNALNHTNFTAVNTLMYAISGTTLQFQDGASGRSLFGLPTQSSNSILAQRQIQIGARLDF
jgi:TonB dependent receptor